jgi:hypothetical protein
MVFMTKELFEALSALCGMWDQYCGSEWGHECMSAGEATQDVLDKYQLLKTDTGFGGKVDWERLSELEKEIA